MFTLRAAYAIYADMRRQIYRRAGLPRAGRMPALLLIGCYVITCAMKIRCAPRATSRAPLICRHKSAMSRLLFATLTLPPDAAAVTRRVTLFDYFDDIDSAKERHIATLRACCPLITRAADFTPYAMLYRICCTKR